MEPIVFNNFKGIGKSEFVGNGEIKNVDVGWREGVVRINSASVQTTGATANLTQWIVSNPSTSGELFALDAGHTLFTSTDSGVTWSSVSVIGPSAGAGQGLGIFKDYVFVAGNTLLDVYGPLAGTRTWATAWQTIASDVLWHPMIRGQDDILYGGAGRYVFSVQEVSGSAFTPGSASTYTWSSAALDLPSSYRVGCLDELGNKLMLGTWVGTGGAGVIDDNKIADIFPWDRVSDSFNLPLRLSENGVHAMANVNNLLYFQAGLQGKLFVTDGTTIQELTKFPEHIADLTPSVGPVTCPGGMIYVDGKILYGDYTGGGAGTTNTHVWSYDLQSGSWKIENTISAGTALAGRVGGMYSTGRQTYLVGWRDSNNNFGIDRIPGGGNRYTSYSAWVTSPYQVIGSKNKPQIISEIEVKLARPLATGQGVRLSYRTDLSAGFTAIPNGTIDFATYTAVQEQNVPFRLEVTNGIQIRCELTTGAGTVASPELMEIILR